jgi:hypothetical protein
MMGTYPIWYRLPTKYSAAIGRLVSRFATLENTIRQLTYALLEIDPKMGRTAVRSARVEDAITMIEDLMALKGFKTSLNLKAMKNDCKAIERMRDQVAHGVWVKHANSDQPVLQGVTGKHNPIQGGKPVKAKINPVAYNVTPTTLDTFSTGVDRLMQAFKQLARECKNQHAAMQKGPRSQ